VQHLRKKIKVKDSVSFLRSLKSTLNSFAIIVFQMLYVKIAYI